MAVTNQDLFENTPIAKAATKLIIPTIIGSLVTVIYSLADTFFVGMLNSKVESAAVSLAAPVLLAFNAIINLFGIGSSSMMSRALGKKDIDTVRRSASIGLYGSIISGAAFALLSLIFLQPLMRLVGATAPTFDATAAYMKWAVILGAIPTILSVVMSFMVRAEGYSLQASIGTMSGCIINIILDPFFIMPWGLDMGAAGAGCATFISNCLACLYFIILIKVKKDQTNIRLHPKYFKYEKETVRGIFGVGVPAAVQNLLNVTGMIVLHNFIKGYGVAAMAAIGIAQRVYMLPLHIALGGSQGVMPLIGYSYANRNYKRFKESIFFVAKIMLPFMIILTIVCWIFAAPIITIFIKESEVIAFGKIFLRGLSLCMPFMFIDFLSVGVFQSIGQGKKALFFAIMRKIVLEIPAIIILDKLFAAYGITYSTLVAEIILAILGVLLLRQIMRDFRQDVEIDRCSVASK